ALAERLPEGAKKGLANLRAQKGDALALKILEGKVAKGNDIAHYLDGEAMPQGEREAAQRAWREAEARLARAKLVPQKVLSNEAVRGATLREQIARTLARLEKMGVLERVVRLIKSKLGFDKVRPDSVKALLGEAISLSELEAMYPESRGYQ